MLKGQEGVTLAILTLSIVILLMIAFTTILIVFDDNALFPTNQSENVTEDYSNKITNEQETFDNEITNVNQ